MVCRGQGCGRELRDSDRYCPSCGRAAVTVACIRQDVQQLPTGRPPVVRLTLRVEATPAWQDSIQVRVESGQSPPSFVPLIVHLQPGEDRVLEIRPTGLVEGKTGSVPVRVVTVGSKPGDWGAREDETEPLHVGIEWIDRRLDAQPAVAVFRHKDDVRVIEIRPGGNGAAYVKMEDPGKDMGGTRPTTSANEPVMHDAPGVFGLRCLVESPGPLGEAKIVSRDEEWSVRIPGYLLPPPPVPRKPAVVVAIDFGTSSTSVARRNLLENGPIVPLGPEPRFPSYVFIPDATSKLRWKFGRQAEEAYQAATGQGAKDFVFIRSLKTILRQTEGDGVVGTLLFDPREVLERFFQWLLHRYIEPDLEDNLSQYHRDDIDFVFTVPVLDNGQQQKAQTEATLEAARRAGFEEFGNLTWVLEPEAAVREILVGRQPEDLWIALMDSGAGTTDITFCHVVPENGNFVLKDLDSLSARAKEAYQEGQLPDEQFGGDALTLLLAVRRVRRYMQALKDAGQSEETARLRAARWFVERLNELGAPGDPNSVDSVLDVIDPAAAFFPNTPVAWHRPGSPFYSSLLMYGLEEAKRAFLAGREFRNQKFEALGLKAEDLKAASPVLAKLLGQCLEDVEHLPDSRFKVVAAVGGNGQNEDLRKAFLECVAVGGEKHKGLVEVEEPLLAVVRGACRLYDDPAEVWPYSVRVVQQEAGRPTTLVEVKQGQTMRVTGRPTSLQGFQASFLAEVLLGEHWYALGKPLDVTAKQPHARVEVKIDANEATVKVSHKVDGESVSLGERSWKLP